MKMTKGVIIGLVGGLLIVVATLLPWASNVGVGGINAGDLMGALTGFGTLVLILGIIGLIMALLSRAVGSIICGVLTLLISLVWFGAWSWISGIINWGTGSSNSVGYGTYIAIIGSILLILGGAMIIGEKKKAAVAPAAPMAAPPVAPPTA